jgi:hypothetical protein
VVPLALAGDVGEQVAVVLSVGLVLLLTGLVLVLLAGLVTVLAGGVLGVADLVVLFKGDGEELDGQAITFVLAWLLAWLLGRRLGLIPPADELNGLPDPATP